MISRKKIKSRLDFHVWFFGEITSLMATGEDGRDDEYRHRVKDLCLRYAWLFKLYDYPLNSIWDRIKTFRAANTDYISSLASKAKSGEITFPIGAEINIFKNRFDRVVSRKGDMEIIDSFAAETKQDEKEALEPVKLVSSGPKDKVMVYIDEEVNRSPMGFIYTKSMLRKDFI